MWHVKLDWERSIGNGMGSLGDASIAPPPSKEHHSITHLLAVERFSLRRGTISHRCHLRSWEARLEHELNFGAPGIGAIYTRSTNYIQPFGFQVCVIGTETPTTCNNSKIRCSRMEQMAHVRFISSPWCEMTRTFHKLSCAGTRKSELQKVSGASSPTTQHFGSSLSPFTFLSFSFVPPIDSSKTLESYAKHEQ